jgi:hypothetical protein
MSAQDGRQIAAEADRAIKAGGLSAAEAQSWIDSLTPYLKYVNVAAYFQLTIDSLQAVVKAGGQPPVTQDSAGAVAVNAQQARDSGAVVQNPTSNIIYNSRSFQNVPGAARQEEYVSSQAQARLAEAGVSIDKGLDAKTIPLSTSQATPPYDINAYANSPEFDPGSSLAGQAAAYQAGVGARGDDGVTVTGNTTKDLVKQIFQTGTGQRIITQPNVLDDYASYTYQLSWYLLDPFQYNAIQRSPTINPATWQLLVQSGGAPITTNPNPSPLVALPGRSPLFPVDFYLDDLELTTSASGAGTGTAVTSTDIKFKVVEPTGITLINRIYSAVKSLYGPGENSSELDPEAYSGIVKNVKGVNSTPPNYLQAIYVMGIKFYGYDSKGNLVAPLRGRNTSTNTYSIVEKYIGFQILDLTFRTGLGQYSKGIEYFITAKPVALNVAYGQNRGTVPFQFELSGTTVKDLLIGKPAQSELKLSTIQDGRVPQARPPGGNPPPSPITPQPVSLSSLVTGQDNPLLTPGGMDFTAGNF